MRRAGLLVALLINAGEGSADAPAAAASVPSATEDELAVGLYLTPWQNEEQRPAASSPSRYTQALAPADPEADRVRERALDSIDSYQRLRRQSLTY